MVKESGAGKWKFRVEMDYRVSNTVWKLGSITN